MTKDEITPDMIRAGKTVLSICMWGKDDVAGILVEIFVKMHEASTPEYQEKMFAARRKHRLRSIIELNEHLGEPVAIQFESELNSLV